MTATQSFEVVVEEDFRLTVTRTDTGLSIGFNSVPGRTYRLETTDELGVGTWTQVGNTITAAGTSTSLDLSPSGQVQTFYRVVRID